MPKRVLEGIVVSTKMEKTVVVRVQRNVQHPIYNKVVKRFKKYMAHTESTNIKEGDSISIIESRPYSKNKKWEALTTNIATNNN